MALVLGIVGSPRAEGNTAVLVREMLRGAAEAGAETQCIVLNELTYRGCQGCYECRTQECCIQRDDATPVLYDLAGADVVILGTPNYMGEMTGQLKLFIDRFCAFMNPDYSSRLTGGKRLGLVFTQGDPNGERYARYYAGVADSMRFLGFTGPCATLVAAGLGAPGQAADDAELMAKAYAIGRELTGDTCAAGA